MNSFETIINQVQKVLTCPACGRHFAPGEIHIRGVLNELYILQTTCSNGHMPILTVALVAPNKMPSTPFNIYHKPVLKEKITTDDVLDGMEEIDKFDGDFQQLWQ